MGRSNIEGSLLSRNRLGVLNKFETVIQTLAGTLTMTAGMPHVLFLDPGGSGRTVLLPPESNGAWYHIVNCEDVAGALTVKEDSNTTTIGSVGVNEIGTFFCDGTTWWGNTSSDLTSLTTTNLTVTGSAQIGNGTADLVGFYNATPVDQPVGATQAAITDNSGGTASDTILVTACDYLYSVTVLAASLANSQEYQFDAGHAGSFMAINARAGAPITTSGKAATITARVAAGAVGGGGVIALSGTYATGAAQAGSAITGAKEFTSAQTFGFTVGSVTTFIEGAFIIECLIRNNDMAAAIAKLAAYTNKFRTDLVELGLIKGAA